MNSIPLKIRQAVMKPLEMYGVFIPEYKNKFNHEFGLIDNKYTYSPSIFFTKIDAKIWIQQNKLSAKIIPLMVMSSWRK